MDFSEMRYELDSIYALICGGTALVDILHEASDDGAPDHSRLPEALYAAVQYLYHVEHKMGALIENVAQMEETKCHK